MLPNYVPGIVLYKKRVRERENMFGEGAVRFGERGCLMGHAEYPLHMRDQPHGSIV